MFIVVAGTLLVLAGLAITGYAHKRRNVLEAENDFGIASQIAGGRRTAGVLLTIAGALMIGIHFIY